MKKLLLLLMLTLGSVVCFAEAPETKFSDEVLTILEGVSAKLQVPISKMWDTLASIQRARFASNFLLGLFLMCACLFSYRHFFKDSEDFSDDSLVLPFLLIVITGIAGFILFIISLTQIPILVNPEYGALKEILNLLK